MLASEVAIVLVAIPRPSAISRQIADPSVTCMAIWERGARSQRAFRTQQGRAHYDVVDASSMPSGRHELNNIANYLCCKTLQGISGAGALGGTGSAPRMGATCRFSGAPFDNQVEPGLNPRAGFKLQRGGHHDESNQRMSVVR